METKECYMKKNKYLALFEGGEGVIIEKKSRFIATVEPVETVEEAEHYLETTTVKYENSAKKIIYMLKGYQNDGYVSYWY